MNNMFVWAVYDIIIVVLVTVRNVIYIMKISKLLLQLLPLLIQLILTKALPSPPHLILDNKIVLPDIIIFISHQMSTVSSVMLVMQMIFSCLQILPWLRVTSNANIAVHSNLD